MNEARVREGGAVVEEITRALGDDVAPESRAWWQYLFAVAELGEDGVRQLVHEVSAVEAGGGMTTADGSRRRTRGGVFFVLAYERLGPKRTESLRWRADRHFQEGMLRRFLGLLSLVSSEPHTGIPVTTPAAPVRPERPARTARTAARSSPATAHAAKAPATKAGPPKPPARRKEPEAVEVFVVRRRPAAGAGSTAKPGPSTPPEAAS